MFRVVILGIAAIAAMVCAPGSAGAVAQSGAVAQGSMADFPRSTQLITVTVATRSATTATVTAYDRIDGQWKPVIGPVPGVVGSAGIGVPADNIPRTPEGTFALDQAFGRQVNPGTHMPYFQSDQQDWWDENPNSQTYNTHVRQVASPGGDSENLFTSGPVYDYAVNIAHNPTRRPGYASGIFLHVSQNEPTQGCVAIDKKTLIAILTWLDPARQPIIEIAPASEPA